MVFSHTSLLTLYTLATMTTSEPQGLCTCFIWLGIQLCHASPDYCLLIFRTSTQMSLLLGNLPIPTSLSQTSSDTYFIYSYSLCSFPSYSTYYSIFLHFCVCDNLILCVPHQVVGIMSTLIMMSTPGT